MNPAQRIFKQLIIIAVYILIIAALVAIFYYAFRVKPTCNDGIKNQGEGGIDCGGPCSKKCENIPDIEHVKVLEKYLIPSSQNQYDALVQINNPNSLFGIASYEYAFDFMDNAGNIITTKEGKSFLLPAQTKYLFAFNINLPSNSAKSFNFRIKSFSWQKFTSYEEPDIAVYQKEFNFGGGGSDFAQLKAKIQNRSKYDFRTIAIRAVVRDISGRPVAINETNINDVRANEEREIILNWSNSFSQDIDAQNIEIEPEANVFDEENFMKAYGSSDQYKSYDSGSDQ
jgi:hypothetical protein